MRLLRAILASRKGRVVLAVLAAYLVWQGWLSLAAPSKIVDEFPGGRERVNVLVTLSFPPERFHVQIFQGFGRVSGTQDNVDRSQERETHGSRRGRAPLLGAPRRAIKRRRMR